MLLAAVFLPLLNAAVKYLSGRYPVLELLWARYAGHLGFMLVVFAPRRGLTLLRSTRPLLQVSRSTLFCVSTFGMFYALGFVPLATAAAISFTAPLIVTALAPFALGERVGAVRAIAVGVGFLGAMVVVRPGSGAYHWAVFLIFISAAASAVTQVLSRKVAGHDPPETSNTYMVLAGFVLASLPLPLYGTRLQVGRTRWCCAASASSAGLGTIAWSEPSSWRRPRLYRRSITLRSSGLPCSALPCSGKCQTFGPGSGALSSFSVASLSC